MKFTKLTKNSAKCLICNDVLESKNRWDYVVCYCGNLHIDGGLDYLKRGATSYEMVQELSEERKFTLEELEKEKERILKMLKYSALQDYYTDLLDEVNKEINNESR